MKVEFSKNNQKMILKQLYDFFCVHKVSKDQLICMLVHIVMMNIVLSAIWKSIYVCIVITLVVVLLICFYFIFHKIKLQKILEKLYEEYTSGHISVSILNDRLILKDDIEHEMLLNQGALFVGEWIDIILLKSSSDGKEYLIPLPKYVREKIKHQINDEIGSDTWYQLKSLNMTFIRQYLNVTIFCFTIWVVFYLIFILLLQQWHLDVILIMISYIFLAILAFFQWMIIRTTAQLDMISLYENYRQVMINEFDHESFLFDNGKQKYKVFKNYVRTLKEYSDFYYIEAEVFGKNKKRLCKLIIFKDKNENFINNSLKSFYNRG